MSIYCHSSKIIYSKCGGFLNESVDKKGQAAPTIFSYIKPSKRKCKELLALIPKKIYSRQQKKAIIKGNAGRYLRATKKKKTLLLNDLCEILHLSRSYIARLLRAFGRVIYYKGTKFVVDLSRARIHGKRDVVGCISSIEKLIKPYREQAKMKGAYNGLDRAVCGEKQSYDMNC